LEERNSRCWAVSDWCQEAKHERFWRRKYYALRSRQRRRRSVPEMSLR